MWTELVRKKLTCEQDKRLKGCNLTLIPCFHRHPMSNCVQRSERKRRWITMMTTTRTTVPIRIRAETKARIRARTCRLVIPWSWDPRRNLDGDLTAYTSKCHSFTLSCEPLVVNHWHYKPLYFTVKDRKFIFVQIVQVYMWPFCLITFIDLHFPGMMILWNQY